jgi:hypothetical protein
MKKTHRCHHVTLWSCNGDNLKPKDTRRSAPKTTTSRSSTSSDRVARSLCSHQSLHNLKEEQHDIFGYLEAAWSYTSNEPRIKSTGGSYKADMAELPKIARSEIFWTACKSGNKTAIAPSFGLWLRWMSTRWKSNFIKFSMEQCFGICSVMYTGKIHEKEAAATRWEQDSGDEDGDNEEELG